MRRPAECLSEALRAIYELEQSPAEVAETDQLMAQGKATLEDYARRADRAFERVDAPQAMAFVYAAWIALGERLEEPEARMCEHMTDLRVPHLVDLKLRMVTCTPCAPAQALLCTPWAMDRCDVCGEKALRFADVRFTLGPALALARVCLSCRAFLVGGDGEVT